MCNFAADMLRGIGKIAMTLCLWLLANVAVAAKFTLVIDAGHGGHDPGTRGRVAKEKDINLKVALAFGKLVEQNFPDVQVVYTRKTDVFVPLNQRAEIANKRRADIFISIHTNAIAGKKQIRGIETYTMGLRRSDEKLSAAQRENDVILMEKDYQQHYAGYDPRSPESQIMFQFINDQNMEESVRLAKIIQQQLCASTGRQNKGVKQDVFLVLRETSMPACLVELGYITTPDEEQYLNSSSGQSALAQGLYQAFRKYMKKDNGDKLKKDSVEKQPKEVTKLGETQREVAQPMPETSALALATANPDKNTPAVTDTPSTYASKSVANIDTSSPVFKVQFTTSDRLLSKGHATFKGLTDVGHYREGSLYKYTVGESADYNEVLSVRRKVAKLFPQAFVVAFKDGKRMDLNEAKTEWNKLRNKR
jgi:N-acetylmuramoyl-L-alanine amidase